MSSTISTLIAALKIGIGKLTTADTSLTAPSTTVVICTAGSSGARVARFFYHGSATSAAAIVRIFLKRSSVYYLLEEMTVLAATSSNTVACASGEIRYPDGLVLESGDTIEASVSISQSTTVGCEYGNL